MQSATSRAAARPSVVEATVRVRPRSHPRIGHGVLLGAGVCVLGPVSVGDGAMIGAGSVVVTNIPDHSVAVGVPARVVRGPKPSQEPVADMDQTEGYILDFSI